MADILTIRQTVQRAQAEELPVSEYALRLWVKQGKVPVRIAGAKQLIYWPNLLAFLTCADGSDNPTHIQAGR